MKLINTLLLSTIATFMVVVLFVQPAVADLPPKAYEAIDWTRGKVNAILSKYNLGYDKKRVNGALLAKKVQEYEKTAKNKNTDFLGAKVDVFINSVKIRLEQQHNLPKQELDGLINTIQHSLRQLEWKGQLTGDRVGQAIDTVQREMAHKKTITEAFWNSIKNDVRSHFRHHPSLLQKKGWQMHNIKGTLEREINAYKVFASDYIGNKVDQSKQWVGAIYDHCSHTTKRAKLFLEDWIDSLVARFI